MEIPTGKARWYALGLVVAIAVASVLVVSIVGGRHRDAYTYMTPEMAPGVAPKQAPEEIERRVLRGLGPRSSLIRVQVVAKRASGGRLVRPGSKDGRATSDGLVWIVRAHGHFRPVTSVGIDDILRTRDGYVVIDDTSGKLAGYGWP